MPAPKGCHRGIHLAGEATQPGGLVPRDWMEQISLSSESDRGEPHQSFALGARVDHARVRYERDETALRSTRTGRADRSGGNLNRRDCQRTASPWVGQGRRRLRMALQKAPTVPAGREGKDAPIGGPRSKSVHARNVNEELAGTQSIGVTGDSGPTRPSSFKHGSVLR
jgi:hypothetical protein